MTNADLATNTAKIVEVIDDFDGDAADKVAMLKSAANVIENNISSDALRQVLYKAINGS